MTIEESEKNIMKLIVWSVTAIIVLIILFNTIGTIGAGQRGILTRFGAVTGTIYNEGIYAKIPFVDNIVVFDTRTQVMKFDNAPKQGDNSEYSSLFCASRDQQDVQLSIVVNYRIKPDSVADVYKNVGKQEYQKVSVLEPIVRNTIKAVASRFTAEELITKRTTVVEEAIKALEPELNRNAIILEELNIVNIEYSPEYTKAIEAKVTAEQDALKAKNVLEQVKFEAEQRVAQAKAEAEAIRIQAEAITQQGGKDYVQLKWIEAWQSGGAKVPNTIVGSESKFLLNLPN